MRKSRFRLLGRRSCCRSCCGLRSDCCLGGRSDSSEKQHANLFRGDVPRLHHGIVMTQRRRTTTGASCDVVFALPFRFMESCRLRSYSSSDWSIPYQSVSGILRPNSWSLTSHQARQAFVQGSFTLGNVYNIM